MPGPDAVQRWRTWRAYDALATGMAFRAAAQALGQQGINVSAVTLARLAHVARNIRATGREPRPADFDAGPKKPAAGPAEAALADAAFRSKLAALYAATLSASSGGATHGRRTGNIALALARMADEPECPEALRPSLRAGTQPIALRRHLRRLFTPEIEAHLRGPRHGHLHGLLSRRDLTVRLPNGSRAAITPGYLVELDDMSINQPFWTELPDGSFLVTRQGLYARDLATGRWLGAELVCRPRESYRAADILRFLHRLMLDYGKFTVLRLEQGVWAARSIQGWRITPGGALEPASWEQDAMPEETVRQIEVGLAQIGVTIQYVHHAHLKGSLEAAFRHLQQVLATFTTDAVNIGAHRGEFEAAAKRLRMARAGRAPGELGFLSAEAAAERVCAALLWHNAHSGADRRWDEAYHTRPLPPLSPDELHVFLPECRQVTVRGGLISVQANGQRQDFRAELLARLGHGYPLAIRFDPLAPELGCALYNRCAPSNPANHGRWAVGEYLGMATWEMPGPQIEVTTDLASGLTETATALALDAGDRLRRRQAEYVRTLYRGLPRVGAPPVARDSAPRQAPAAGPERRHTPASHGRHTPAAGQETPAGAASLRGGWRLGKLLEELPCPVPIEPEHR
jgi:hypothetical protein